MAKCLDSIKICALRATLLTATGAVAAGPNNYVSTARETKLDFTADIDQGKDLFYRNGCDRALASYKSDPLVKRETIAIDLFGIEPAVEALILGDVLIDDDDGNPIGFEDNIQVCPADPPPSLVALEAWSFAWDCDAQDPVTPYYYHLWPMAQLNKGQTESLQTDLLQPQLVGFTRRNPSWGHGPYGGIVRGAAGGGTYLNTSGNPAHFLTSTIPPDAICGFGSISPSS
jgi:hypothetical protein